MQHHRQRLAFPHSGVFDGRGTIGRRAEEAPLDVAAAPVLVTGEEALRKLHQPSKTAVEGKTLRQLHHSCNLLDRRHQHVDSGGEEVVSGLKQVEYVCREAAQNAVVDLELERERIDFKSYLGLVYKGMR